MPKENATEDNTAAALDVLTEVATPETEVQKAEGLPLRDALEVALEANKPEGKANDDGARKADDRSAGDKVQAKADTGRDIRSEVKNEGTPKKYEPPAEWNKEEKEDFTSLSPKQQEAALRLHTSRQSKLEEIKREAAELQWAKDLVKEVTPYLKTIGEKKSPHEALVMALKMHREFETTPDPKAAAAAYLKAKGIEVPEDFVEKRESSTDERITPLQERLNALESKAANEERSKFGAVLNQAWAEFSEAKNAAGGLRYPDTNESESGLRLASNIGSLVGGQTEISKQFIANVRARIPDLTYPKLIEEAYRFYGGKVVEAEAPTRTQDAQKHIAKSSRAASSRPGSGSTTTSSGPVKKYKTYREAAEAALAELKQE